MAKQLKNGRKSLPQTMERAAQDATLIRKQILEQQDRVIEESREPPPSRLNRTEYKRWLARNAELDGMKARMEKRKDDNREALVNQMLDKQQEIATMALEAAHADMKTLASSELAGKTITAVVHTINQKIEHDIAVQTALNLYKAHLDEMVASGFVTQEESEEMYSKQRGVTMKAQDEVEHQLIRSHDNDLKERIGTGADIFKI